MSNKVFFREKPRWGARLFILLIVAAVGFYFYPSPISPAACHFPIDKGFTGPFAENDGLLRAEAVTITGLSDDALAIGPEDIAIADDGTQYTGLENGDIIRIGPDGAKTIIANTGGRPLGLAFDPEGHLIIADAVKGLLRLLLPSASLEMLTKASDNVLFGFTDDVDVGPDGSIYFSDATYAYGFYDLNLEFLECQPHGRLLRYDPISGRTETLADDLYFANGVAVSPGGDFVLVNETPQYRVKRYWLKGERAGQMDIAIENLPGFPDGISSDGKGGYWLALFGPRDKTLDSLQGNVGAKKLIAKLPDFLSESTTHRGIVVHLNAMLEVDAVYQDPKGDHVFGVTSIEQKGDRLYIGNLKRGMFHTLKIDP